MSFRAQLHSLLACILFSESFDKAFSLPEALGVSAKPDLPKTFRFQLLPIYMREKPVNLIQLVNMNL